MRAENTQRFTSAGQIMAELSCNQGNLAQVERHRIMTESSNHCNSPTEYR